VAWLDPRLTSQINHTDIRREATSWRIPGLRRGERLHYLYSRMDIALAVPPRYDASPCGRCSMTSMHTTWNTGAAASSTPAAAMSMCG
jgi:hypothetical protein